ncbi:hypothetical protein B0H14DRAFT_2608663 [Mycena olivaceomarginata]|nr:hypothetical protein B0H14DRAFT_2608663 [Mycena olivaceomarginata]
MFRQPPKADNPAPCARTSVNPPSWTEDRVRLPARNSPLVTFLLHTCDLGRASECFEAAAERLRTSFKLFEGSVCGACVKSLQQSSTWAPTKGVHEGGERVRSMDVAWEWLRDSGLFFRQAKTTRDTGRLRLL